MTTRTECLPVRLRIGDEEETTIAWVDEDYNDEVLACALRVAADIMEWKDMPDAPVSMMTRT